MQYKIHHIKNYKNLAKTFDKFLIFVAIIAPAMTIPQIVKIFKYQSAIDVSLLTWVMYTILDIPWIIYAIYNKNIQILVAYILWFLTNIGVVIGVVLYG